MRESETARWLPLAALLSTASGLCAAWQLAAGRFAVGGGLAVLSVLALRLPISIWSTALPTRMTARQRRLALVAVTLVGLFFRTYQMVPPGLWGDDALNGLLAFDILDGKIRSPFQIVVHSFSHFHALSNYPIAAAFALFGPGLATIRLPGVLLGAAAVPLLYGTMSPLFGAPTALLAALFFASSPLEIGHDKGLIQIVLGQFLPLLGMCLVVRGLTGRRRWLIPLAGLPVALSLCTYHSAKLAPLIPILFLARALPAFPAEERRTLLRYVGAAALVLLVCALPGTWSYAQHPGTLGSRIGGVSLLPVLVEQQSLRPLWDSFWRTLMIFHYQQGPEYHWFGLGFDPAFDLVLGFLVLHGMTRSLLGLKEPRHFLLLAWVAVGLAPGILSTGAPRAYRILLATPPLYVWAAWPLVQLAGAAGATGFTHRFTRALAAALLVAVPLIDFNTYFYRVYTHPLFHHFQGERIVDMARTLRSKGPGWNGYLLSDSFDSGHETFRFLNRAWGLTMRDVASLAEVLPLGEKPEGGALFMMSGAAAGAAPALAEFYPGGERFKRSQVTLRNSWFDPAVTPSGSSAFPVAEFFAVPRVALDGVQDGAGAVPTPPAHGLLATYTVGGRTSSRIEPYPFYWFFPPTAPAPFGVEFVGGLTVREPGGYRLVTECNGRWKIEIDGMPALPETPLAAGGHSFRMRIDGVPQRLWLRISWRRPDEPSELVPPEAWTPLPPP